MHHLASLSALLALSGASLAASSSSSPSRSAGCGKTPSVEPGHHHVRNVTVSSAGGGVRSYILAIPTNYDVNKPVPLILSFHGNGKNATNQLYLSDFWRDDWNTPGAVSVYPNGVDGKWSGAPYDTSGPDDVAFTHGLLDALAGDLCIDETRVYCSGKSLGGGFCNVLACDKDASARFAAIAPVSGAYYTTPANESFTSACHPARGYMPVLEFHGDPDPVISYEGGEHYGVDLRSVPDWSSQWAQLAGCPAANSSTNPAQDMPYSIVTHYNYTCPIKGATSSSSSSSSSSRPGIVQHYKIDGLGHVWPSVGWNPDNNGHGTVINATPLIFSFFGNYSLTQAEVGAAKTSRRALAEREEVQAEVLSKRERQRR